MEETTIQVNLNCPYFLKAKCSHQYLTRQVASPEIKTNLDRALFSGIYSCRSQRYAEPFRDKQNFGVYISVLAGWIYTRKKQE